MSDVKEFDELLVKCPVSVSMVKPKRRNYVKKVEREWTHDETMQLILAIKERRALWNLGSPEYKLPKTDAWKEVANAIGNIKVDDAKAKWTNLRISFKNNFARYRSKMARLGTDKAEVVIHWRYFKSMMFLEVDESQQSTESTLSVAQASDTSTDASIQNDISAAPLSPSGVVVIKRERHSSPTPSPSPSPPPSVKSMRELRFYAPNSVGVHEDKFSAFGYYIASELRALPPDQGTFVQRELNRQLLRLLEFVETPAAPSTSHQQ